jgi:hypothetical protein
VLLAAAHSVVESWNSTGEGTPHDFVRDVLARAVIHLDEIEIKIDPQRLLARLLGDQARPASARLADGDEQMIRIAVAVKLRKHGSEVKLIVNGADNRVGALRPNPVLVKAVARAHSWMDQLVTGSAASIRQIAKANDMQYRYISKVLRLAFVAPKIIEAILAGRQSDDITFARLISGLPLAWPT